MESVKAKKHLGQHFLTDLNIAKKIVEAVDATHTNVLEIGPGMGVLTQYLVKRKNTNLHLVDIDTESIEYLNHHYPTLKDKIHCADYLRMDVKTIFTEKYAVVGNFPYNISSQIFFKVLADRENVTQVVGMIQKEVAERIAAPHGSKTYGITSVLLQAFFDIKYLFTVNENVFSPPPKVKSAVISLVPNGVSSLDCNERLFFTVVKTAFGQRRKTMRNSLRAIEFNREAITTNKVFDLRPEQLSVAEFIALTKLIEENR